MEVKTYLVKSKEGYKIGKSKNPEKRLKAIQTSAPSATLIAYGTGVEESRLHQQYKDQRIRGEWFKLRRADVESITRRLNNELSHISKNYNSKLNYVINFGMYKGVQIQMMTEKRQLSYIRWYLKNCTRRKSKVYKIFKWWLKEMKKA